MPSESAIDQDIGGGSLDQRGAAVGDSLPEAYAGNHAGGQGRQPHDVPPVHGQLQDLPVLDHLAERGVLHLEQLDLPADGHALGHRSDLQRHVDARALAHLQDEAFAHESLEAGLLRTQGVCSRQQRRDREVAGSVGFKGPLQARFRVSDGDGGRWNRRSGVVQNGSGDFRRIGLSLEQVRAQHQQSAGEDTRAFHGIAPLCQTLYCNQLG